MKNVRYIAAACVTVYAAGVASAATADPSRTCVPGYEMDDCGDIESCRARLDEDPYDVPVRIALCESMLDQGDLLEAMVVLRHGLESCGSRSYACSQLEIALSNVEELAEKDTPDLRAERRREQAFKRQYCLGPSASDASLRACNEALLSYGEDGALYEALGGKYQRRGQPALAVQNLEQAVALLPPAEAPTELLEEARAARSELADICLAQRDLGACNAAILAGAPDELELQLRRGRLLLDADRRDAALQALLAAQSLAPGNRGLAERLLPLLEDALATAPDDPELNTARARSLTALGRVDAAIVAFRRTLELSPDDADASRQLLTLRERRSSALERDCFAADDIASCRARLIPGEPDEQRILSHIATLEAAAESGRDRARDEVARVDPIDETAADDAPADTPDDASPIPPPAIRNVAAADGSTY